MKVLFCDLLFQRGNRHIDTRVMDILAGKNEVYVLSSEDHLVGKLFNKSNIHFLGNKYSENPQGKVSYMVQIIKRMILTAQNAKRLKPDVIYISVYETRVFPIGYLFFDHQSKRKIVLLENNNIDLLSNSIHRAMYKLFAKKVHHIVYENFFGEYLNNVFGISKQKIHMVPHIQYRSEVSDVNSIDKSDDKIFDCICISSSNDDEVIGRMIEYEKETSFFRENEISCRIKSKKHLYNDEYLVVDNKFFSNDEYNELYANCKCVLIPFPEGYNFRMSGSIIDAVSHHKRMVTTNFTLARKYSEEYKGIISIGSNIEELFMAILKNCKDYEECTKSFIQFEKDRSEAQVSIKLEEMLQIVGNGGVAK